MDIENLLVGIDDIATKLGINSRSRLQTFYETALEGRETLDLEVEGFTNAPIQLDSEVEFAEAKQYLRAMATYVDNESPVLARGRKVELNTWKQAIPTQRRNVKRGKDDYKKMLLAAQKEAVNGMLVGKSVTQSVRDYLWNNLFESLQVIPDSHVASKNYQVGQMLSKRQITLTKDNNPGGIVGITFESKVPKANVVDETWFTVAANGTVTYVEVADPILTLKKKIRGLKLDRHKGYPNVRVEMNAKTFFTLVEHPKIMTRLGYKLRPELDIVPKNDANALRVGTEKYLSEGDEFIINFFREAIGANELKLHTAIVGVDKLNAVSKEFDTDEIDTFDEGVVLIRPTGNIGVIQPVMVVRPDKQAVYADILNGWGIIEYFYDARTRTQEWISEVSYLAMPTQPRNMYYINVQGETAAGDTYTAVTNPTGNPSTNGYYELVEDEYVLSTDTTVDSGKTYYTKS